MRLPLLSVPFVYVEVYVVRHAEEVMDDQHLLSSDWRNRSPENADQEYFIDKMRMLKVRLRKYEEVSDLRVN